MHDMESTTDYRRRSHYRRGLWFTHGSQQVCAAAPSSALHPACHAAMWGDLQSSRHPAGTTQMFPVDLAGWLRLAWSRPALLPTISEREVVSGSCSVLDSATVRCKVGGLL